MIAWRTDHTVPQAATAKGKGTDYGGITQIENVAVIREGASGARGLAGSIKQLFQELKQALTGKATSPPEPKKRTRRGSGETRRGFRLAARILGRVVRSIFHAGHFTWEPPDELDEAQRQQLAWNSEASNGAEGLQGTDSRTSNHLSPHL